MAIPRTRNQLASSINDPVRVAAARNGLFALRTQMEATGKKFMWWRCDDIDRFTTAAAVNWFNDTPSEAANSAAAFFTDLGNFNG